MSDILRGDHWAMFGDGNMAQIITSKPYYNKDEGAKYYRFMLIPSERIEKMYNIKEEQDPATGIIIRDYHYSDIVWLEQGTSRSRCWIYVDFDGGETPASRHYLDLKELIKDNDKLLRSAEAAKNRMFAELRKERESQYDSMVQKVKLMRELARARGRVDSADDEEGEQ